MLSNFSPSQPPGMDRLAGLGIQVSRSEEPDMDRLSKLGISVGRSASQDGPSNNGPRLPPGMSVSGGPRPANLPPGMSVSGGPPRPNLPPGMSMSGGPRPNLPPGMVVSGGPRPQGMPPGVNVSGGPRPNLPPGVNISGGPPRGPRPNLPPGMQMTGGPRGPRPPAPQRASMGSEQGSDSEEDEEGQMPSTPQGPNGPRPNLAPRMNMSGGPRGPRPNLPPGMQMSGGPRGPAPSLGGPRGPTPNNLGIRGPAPVPKTTDEESGNSSPKENGEDPPSPESPASPAPQRITRSRSPNKPPPKPPVQKPPPEASESDEGHDDGEEDDNAPKENGTDDGEANKEGKSLEEVANKPLVNGATPSEEENDDKNMDTEEDEESQEASENGQADAPAAPKEGEAAEAENEKNPENIDSEKEKNSETTEKEKDSDKVDGKESTEKGAKVGEKAATADGEFAEGDEGWEGYEGEEGWEGYEGYEGEEGEEGWEGYEGEEGWEGYEGEEGWEEGEEGTAKPKGPGKPSEKDAAKPKEKPSEGAEDDEEMETDEEASSSISKDPDGAPKHPDEESAPSTPHKMGNISMLRLSQEDMTTPNKKLPEGISMSSVPSLPAGISISTPGKPNLPPGISISPFKKPSTSVRQSMDEDSRSVGSRADEEEEASSEHIPTIGQDTSCVFCFQSVMGKKPRLLTCLHSACLQCFEDKIRVSIRDSDNTNVVGLDDDGDEVQMAPEVTCPICKATTSEDEVMINHFVDIDDEEEAVHNDDQHPCGSCEERAMATSKCNDCDEYLCNDCVRAHQRVKMTKDHEIIVVASGYDIASGIKYCDIHTNEKLTLYCESCDSLNCRDCQLSEKHRNHRYRYSHEVAPEIKLTLMKNLGDIKMKKSGLEESRGILNSRFEEVNIKENSLLQQLREIKSYLVSKIDTRCRELEQEVRRQGKDKRKLLDGRKTNLDRTFSQADNCLAFVTNVVNGTSDEKMLLTKKMMARQMKRLRRANHSVNIAPAEMELKLELYFQHFTGSGLNSNLDSVLKMVMSDIKASAVPIEAPKPKPAPAPAPAARQPPSTPTRPNMGTPMGRGSPSPAKLNAGGVSRQLSTPQKQMVPRSPQMMRQASPAGRGQPMRGAMGGPRMQVMQGGRGQAMQGGRGQVMQRGRGGQQVRMAAPALRGRGQPMMGQQRGSMGANRGMVRPQQPQMIRGRGGQMVRGGTVQMRGGQPMRGGPQQRMIRPAIQGGMGQGARRGRPPGPGNGAPLALTNQTYNSPGIRPQRPQKMNNSAMGGYQTQSIPQNKPRPIRQAGPRIVTMPDNIQSGGSSWHTPSQVGITSGGVSPPSSDITSFKIKLPSMSMKSEAPNGNIMGGIDPLAADSGVVSTVITD